MYLVARVDLRVTCKTALWFTQKVIDEVEALKRKGKHVAFSESITRCAENGFSLWEGTVVRLEWGGVYRVGFQDKFRLIGFYERDVKDNFVVIDAFWKRGHRLTRQEVARIDVVVNVRKTTNWQKVPNEIRIPWLGNGEQGI